MPSDRRTLAYFPVDRGENDYIPTFQQGLRRLGWNVQQVGYRGPLGWPGRWAVSVINWPEHRMTMKGDASAIVAALLTGLWLSWMRLCSKKLVFVLHNRFGHNAGGLVRRMSRAIVAYSTLLADTVIVHSPRLGDWQDKYRYVPHPLYAPSAVELRPADVPACFDLSRSYLIFGRIEPYKNIHAVLQRWPRGVPLVIAGPLVSDDYFTALTRLVAERGLESDVRFLPRLVSEAEVAWLMRRCRAVIVSHDGPETIVSGAFFHAISYGCPVLAKKSEFFEAIAHSEIFMEFACFESWDALPDRVQSLAVSDEARARIHAQSMAVFGFEGFVGCLERALRS